MEILILDDNEPNIQFNNLHVRGTGRWWQGKRVVRTREQLDLMLDVTADVLNPNNSGWDQNVWVRRPDGHPVGYCRTSGCYAGHVLARAGVPLRWSRLADLEPAVGDCPSFPEVSAALLGLAGSEAEELFDSGNNREDIALTIARIVNRTRLVDAP